MAAGRIIIPNVMPALDINGNPVAGAKLTFYVNETTTLLPVYTTSALSVAHPNPLSADAAGAFASIFADTAVPYSVAITDADDAPIVGLRNRDNVKATLFYGDDVVTDSEAAQAAAEAARDAAQGYASDAAGASGFVDVSSRAGLAGLTLPAAIKQIATRGYATEGDGGGWDNAVRTSYATIVSAGYPAASYQRSADRFMPDESTDAVNGGYWLLAAQPVSPLMLGAVGDGVSDDTMPLEDALWFLSLGVAVDLSAKRYKISSPIAQVIPDGVSAVLAGEGATIDGTAVTNPSPGAIDLIKLGGQRLSSSLLNASPAEGDTSITTASSIGAVAGNIVLITSTDLWNPTRANYWKGELSLVQSVSGNTLTLADPLFDGYTAATTTVHRLAMPEVSVSGVEILMDDAQIGLRMEYVRNPRLAQTDVSGARYAGSFVNYFYGGQVTGNSGTDSWYTGTGTSYGLIIGTGQYLSAQFNNYAEARHGITMGAFEPTRACSVAFNKCRMHQDEAKNMAIDAHGNVELCSIVDNDAEGITCSAPNMTIARNRLSGQANYALLTVFQEVNSDYYNITDNEFDGENVGDAAIWVSPAEDNLTISRLTLSGNKGSVGGTGIRLQPRSSGVTGCAVTLLEMRQNAIVAGTGQSFLINANGAATYAVGSIEQSGNVFSSLLNDGYTVIETNPVGPTKSVGDTFMANKVNGFVAYFAGTTVRLTCPTFIGNTGGAGASRSVRYVNTGRVTIDSPTYSGLTFRGEPTTSTELVETGYLSPSPSINNVAVAKLKTAVTGVEAIGNAAATLTGGVSLPVQVWFLPLTADRAVTLPTAGVFDQTAFTVVRLAASTGAFNLNVGTGPLAALLPGQWCQVTYSTSTGWIVSARGALAPDTGWTAATGTAAKGAYATYAGQNVSAAYVEAEAQATDDAVKALSERFKALEDSCRAKGVIN
jgi:hypothetical protein